MTPPPISLDRQIQAVKHIVESGRACSIAEYEALEAVLATLEMLKRACADAPFIEDTQVKE